MTWSFNGDKPIYLQVMEQLSLGIISGELPPGSRLPAVRELAVEAAINPNTMQKALGELEREGLIYAQRTNGRFVTEDGAMIANLRYRVAREKVLELRHQMERLGYTPQQLIEMLQAAIDEEGMNQDGKQQ